MLYLAPRIGFIHIQVRRLLTKIVQRKARANRLLLRHEGMEDADGDYGSLSQCAAGVLSGGPLLKPAFYSLVNSSESNALIFFATELRRVSI